MVAGGHKERGSGELQRSFRRAQEAERDDERVLGIGVREVAESDADEVFDHG